MTTAIDRKENILILSCLGGNGHEAARSAIEEHLGSRYNFTVYYPFQDLLVSQFIIDSEKFYNGMVMYGLNGLINYSAKISPYYLTTSLEYRIVKKMKELLEGVRPICVISLAPIINRFCMEEAVKHRVPYSVVTLDADLTNWVKGLDKVQHLLAKVIFTIGAELPETRGILTQAGVPEQNIRTIGFPLRKEFTQEKPNRSEICRQLHLPINKPIVMMMWGGAGSERIYKIAQKLFPEKLNAYFVVIAGKNELLQRRVQTLPLHRSNGLAVVGFTKRVADYMAVSKILISKPGPGTINEVAAIYSQVGRPYLLLDADADCLFWERPNIEIAIRGNFSETFTLEELPQKVSRCLHTQNPLTRIPENQFAIQIERIVENMVQTGLKQRVSDQFLQLFPEDLQKVFADLNFHEIPHLTMSVEAFPPLEFIHPLITFSSADRNTFGVIFNGTTIKGERQHLCLYKEAQRSFLGISIRNKGATSFSAFAAFYSSDQISRLGQWINPPKYQASFFKSLLNGTNPEFELLSRSVM